jgi:hypothetical protein
MPKASKATTPERQTSPHVLSLKEELSRRMMKRLGSFEVGDLEVQVSAGRDSIWCLVRRPGRGGLAVRGAYIGPVDFSCRKVAPAPGEALRLQVDSVLGRHELSFASTGDGLHRLRVVVRFTPAVAISLPFFPRDLYPLDESDDPSAADGNVEAAQRGLNGGMLYFRFLKPAFGSVLYFQNLTALNPYFKATGTKPDAVVGGIWPELGYQAPTHENQEGVEEKLLPAGEEVILSDAIIVLRDWAAESEQELSRQFLQMLAIAYEALDLPKVEYRDWVGRSERTLRDLEHSPSATERHYGNLYVLPYVEGEVPDVMVQVSVVAALHDYAKWLGEPVALEAELKKGLERFYDPKLKTLRRFLPNVGKGKDRDAVDSWYLYHPMLNLGRLALDGDEQARDLLLRSIDYGIEAAHHFKYIWPVMYKYQDFSILQKSRGDERYGQTDVGGLYAFVMVQCYELTGEQRFVDEARAAVDAAKGVRFDLLYQANLTVWGAAACMRLWRITGEDDCLSQSYAYLAGFFHNCEIWESKIGAAEHFTNFLGATCLHDAPYMAMYECFECFSGFEEYLAQAGPDLEPAARLLIGEFCKYTLHRAWNYYPDTLPKGVIHQGEHQSGIIKPELSFPLEDLYADGQAPGQVGQEIYGSGGGFVFATRSNHRVDNAPFRLSCNHFIRSSEQTGERALSIQLDGGDTCLAEINLVRLQRKKLPEATLVTAGGDRIKPHFTSDDRMDYRVPADGRLTLSWD